MQPFDFALFGGTGDLAMRKLLPALYYLHRNGDLPDDGRIVGIAQRELTREQYVASVREHCTRFIPARDFIADAFDGFARRLDYARMDARDPAHYGELAGRLQRVAGRARVFYLSTPPDLFATVCRNLADVGLIDADARVVLEKPLGRDLDSARKINEEVSAVFDERQVYRIDHYLGKEPVQNLIALRFGNVLFEPLWNRTCVHDVQITIAEEVGVEGRGAFYDRTGALRDMVQNHLLQLLCMIAMEPPSSIDPDALRDEKLKVLRALEPFDVPDVLTKAVRGQYRAGAVDGQPVPGYRDEPGIALDSDTETFVALKAEINNWRWSGVPFYLRTGKRMHERMAEIVINFRDVPHSIFPGAAGVTRGNRLVIQLQPEEELKLYLMAKVPGDHMNLQPVHLSLDFGEQSRTRSMDAYERLLTEVLRGSLTLFMRHDELEAAWRWIDPIREGWRVAGDRPKPYIAGTWGPASSSALVGRDGVAWHEED